MVLTSNGGANDQIISGGNPRRMETIIDKSPLLSFLFRIQEMNIVKVKIACKLVPTDLKIR